MKYAVAWRPSALQDLADIWNRSANRDAVTTASNTIDDCLVRDPLTQGESREGTTRILFVEPLALYYDVDPANYQVTVLDVWRYPT